MIKALSVLVVSGLMVLYEVPKMKKNNMKREVIVFVSLLGFSTVIAVLLAFGIDVPNPLEGLRQLLKPIGTGIHTLLGSKGGS